MKKKIATVWLAGCSGCHMSLLDIDERILDVIQLADIVKCPIVDGKELPEVDVTLVEGAVGSPEHAEELRHIRKQSKIVVSLGDCAVNGNISAMRNFFTVKDILERSYVEKDSTDDPCIPNDKELITLSDKVVPLHDIVKIDYYIPGCPPSADAIFYVLAELLNDRVPDLSKEGILKNG